MGGICFFAFSIIRSGKPEKKIRDPKETPKGFGNETETVPLHLKDFPTETEIFDLTFCKHHKILIELKIRTCLPCLIGATLL